MLHTARKCHYLQSLFLNNILGDASYHNTNNLSREMAHRRLMGTSDEIDIFDTIAIAPISYGAS